MNPGSSDELHLLHVDADPESREALSRAASDRDGVSLSSVETVDEARERLEDGPDVDCLVSGQAFPDGSGLGLLRSVRERDRLLPFVLAPRDGSERLAAEATELGVSRYVPRSDGDGRLLESALEAAEEGRRLGTWRRSELMLESLLAEAPLAITFKDREGRHMRVSEGVLSGSWEDPIGKTDPEMAPDDIEAQVRQSYEDDLRVIETGESILEKEEQYHLNADDEKSIWQLASRMPWRDEEGNVRGVIGVSWDITDRKERERELQRQKQRLDRFASFASHDLRNPLNVAQGYLEHAVRTGDETALEAVDEALDRMDELIDELLASARSDEGTPSIENVPAAAVIERAWETVGVEAATLRSDVPEEALIRADEAQLRQLFENLFKNAIDHAGPDVEVTVGTIDGGFFVEDDGPGIPPEDRDAVLEYGYTDDEDGSGIGLAIVTQVVESHDWELSVDEGTDGGARFEVRDPFFVVKPRPVAGVDQGRRVELAERSDVGGATPAGSAEYDSDADEWTVRGGGLNLWNDDDECHLVHATVEGDVRIAGRVTEIDPVYDYSKAGLMIRAGPESGEPLGFVGLTGGAETETLWKTDPDDLIVSSQLRAETPAPHWYRLDRLDDRVTYYHSSDGETWEPIDQKTVDWTDPVTVGLAVCSLNPNEYCTAVFDTVSVVDL